MPDSDTGGSEHYNLRASVVGIVISIVLAGVANVWMLASWKGAMDAKMGALESQLATIGARLERSDGVAARVSVLETKLEAVGAELTRVREGTDALRVELARSRPQR